MDQVRETYFFVAVCKTDERVSMKGYSQKLRILEGSCDLMTSFDGIPTSLQTALFCE